MKPNLSVFTAFPYSLQVFLPAFLISIFLHSSSLCALEDSLTPPFSYGEGVFYTTFSTGYYYTEDNYMESFTTQPLSQVLNSGQNSSSPFFHYMNTDFSIGYNLTDWFEMEAFANGFWFAQSGDGHKLRFSGPQVKRGGAALRSQQHIKKVFGFIPELSFSFPFFAINQQTEKPITDDGSIHFTPSLWLYGAIGDIFYPFVYTGFKLRTNSLSPLLQWKAGGILKADMAELGLHSYGFWSIARDKSSTSFGDRFNLLKRTNAGSLKFFSANPGLIGFMAWLSWHFPYVTLRLSGNIDINGSYYSKGYTFLASLIVKTGKKKRGGVNAVFNKQQEEIFEPQITEDEKSVNDIFENSVQDSLIQEEAEKALEEAEKMEESNIQQSPSSRSE